MSMTNLEDEIVVVQRLAEPGHDGARSPALLDVTR